MDKLALAPRPLTHGHHLYQGAGDVKVEWGFAHTISLFLHIDRNLMRRLQNDPVHDRSILSQLVLFEAVLMGNLHLLYDCPPP